MFSNVLRDVELVESLRPTLAPMGEYLAQAVEILAKGWGARGRRRQLLATATRHAVDFQTWRSLTADSEITRAEAVTLIAALVEVAATPRRRAVA